MGTIFAIGGGEIGDFETINIDKQIVECAKVERAKALFIPTASNDAGGYVDTFRRVYGEHLGCEIDTLLLVNNSLLLNDIREKILNADIIYVGGGNTRKMLEIWRRYKVDECLKEAYEKGVILSGLSAGSICWFKNGHSDSLSFDGDGEWKYIVIDALGFIDVIHCPHFNEDIREENFKEKLMEYDGVGIAIENNCAIEFKDGYYKIHKSNSDAKAYKMYKLNGEIVKIELDNVSEYKELENLLKK